MIAFLRWLGLAAPKPSYTVRHYSPREYLESRAAGGNCVRVEGGKSC
jgi:hypothetical protein